MARGVAAMGAAAAIGLAGTAAQAEPHCKHLMTADLTGTADVDVQDVQCSLLITLWSMDEDADPATKPECANGLHSDTDINCDTHHTILDAQIALLVALGEPLPDHIDSNGDGCPDLCMVGADGGEAGDATADPTAPLDPALSCEGNCGGLAAGGCWCDSLCTQLGDCCQDACDVCGQCGEGTACGDGICLPGETCATCPEDCGQCETGGGGLTPSTESCCAPKDTPSCDDPDCVQLVCSEDSFCCNSTWDAICVAVAEQWCEGCGAELSECGDGVCQGLESCQSCPADCGECAFGSCCEASPAHEAGCDDPVCQALICEHDPFCCNNSWDIICAEAAQVQCEGCGAEPPVCGDGICVFGESCQSCPEDCGACPPGGGVPGTPGTGSCCAPSGGVGCEDLACVEQVCPFDPFCCDTQWDWLCADAALSHCEACDGLAPECGDGVCEWGETCVNCQADCGECGGGQPGGPPSEPTEPGTGSCCASDGGPGCEDAECQSAVCAVDSFCCEFLWDGICAGAAADLCEACGGTAPECGDAICEPGESCQSCPEDCGECGGQPGGPGLPGAGSCCASNGTVGCDDPDCEAIVCAADPFCCEATWDGICGNAAIALCEICDGQGPACGDGLCQANESCQSCPEDCGQCEAPPGGEPGTGDCCASNVSPGCDDPDCEAAVCAVDPFCCETQWDSICADGALGSCATCDGQGPECGDGICEFGETCVNCQADCGPCGGGGQPTEPGPPGTGDCCVAKNSVGCEDLDCESFICAFDPFCCNNSWDNICASAAQEGCEACGAAPAECGDGVCDPDESCQACPEDCGECDPAACCEANSAGGTGCADDGCEQAVCAADPFCCQTQWDAVCGNAAKTLCDVCEFEFNDGSCCEVHSAPGCGDESCAEAVCEVDNFCCLADWDALCVNVAVQLCGDACQ